jgi:hypothetical protein
MSRLAVLAGLVILMAAQAGAEWELSEFMISTWGGPTPTPGGNNASIETIATANLTVVMCGMYEIDWRWQLEECRRHGIKALIKGVSPEEAAQLRDDEAVWGYYIMDEPTKIEQYEQCARKREALHEADPNHPAYVNLGGSYRRIHSRFIETFSPEVLSHDYYHWWWNYDTHFPMLEEYYAAAKEAGIPLIAWVECNTAKQDLIREDRYVHLPDNLQRLRMSVYTRLAYGVKGIQWWKGNQLWADDELTPVGRDAALIGAELKVLGPTLVRLQSVNVFHTPALPEGTRQLPDDYWARVAGDDWVVGALKGPEDNDYLLLANRDHTADRRATMAFSRPGVRVDRMDKAAGEWLPLPAQPREGESIVEFSVAAGDGELLRVG